MKPNPKFTNLPKPFWANIRTISQGVGYTQRSKGSRRTKRATKERGPVKVPTLAEVQAALEEIDLTAAHLIDGRGKPTGLGSSVMEYFDYRADVLHRHVEPHLMNRDEARGLFEQLQAKMDPRCPLPMNKQKGEKKAPAYFTCIVNMLIEANIAGLPCDYDPRELTTVTLNQAPLRTLARRIDGAFPSAVNPTAVWEIKEYYYTTTFGSRVADGVYETLLDGLELEELREHEQVDVEHYLMVDDHFTWWECGRSYLCRLIDMLHMGYVDEILFGREVVDRVPAIARSWVKAARQRSAKKPPPLKRRP